MQSILRAMLFCLSLHLCLTPILADLPIWPTEVEHPSSQVYDHSFLKQTYKVERRQVIVYLPISQAQEFQKNTPVLVYGHGQALGVDAYERTFIHLARKGIAVIFPQYDKGFFDQDWKRMGRDYVDLTRDALGRFGNLDPNDVVFSGHSKGAYIALMAASTPGALLKPKSLLLFTPAGFDKDQFKTMDPAIATTVIWGVGDKIIKRELAQEIYQESPAKFSQLIQVESYPDFAPEHFYTVHKRNLFGGRDGVHPFHFYGVWPWVFGAVKENYSDYLYGERAREMGLSNNFHKIERRGTY